ncbi:MAG: hypothetical protein MMC23_005274 [Stictis urceolatum]|nr:hypothetical protein [Stictis urceolata]
MVDSKTNFPPIQACLFDMDGLLIDSEDIYTQITNIILNENGRPNLPWSIKAQLQGRPGPEAYQIFAAWADLPVDQPTFQARQAALQRELFKNSRPLPGVPQLLNSLIASKTHLALATSTHATNYALKTAHLPDLFSLFPDSQRVLGDDPRIPKGKGKPAPDIYLLALETINENLRDKGEKEIRREECLVFEDSVPGVEAGRRAGMRVVWCPHPELLKEFAGREEDVLAGLTGSEAGETGLSDEDSAQSAEKMLAGWPGKRGDGWADLVKSLDEFDLAKYGVAVNK